MRSDLFVKGPIPLTWVARASVLPSRAIAVGLVLWFYVGMRRTRTVPLASAHLFPDLGISRHTLRRALQALEDAELIAVERRRGHPPIVTVLK
jgi:hypothetical protein